MIENLKLGATLLVITAIAGLILAFAYDITRAPIEAKAKENQAIALKVVLAADEFEELKADNAENIKAIFEAKNSGQTTGHVFNVIAKGGYGGDIELMVGIKNDGSISGIKILKQSETPGLGSKAAEPGFTDQFKSIKAEKELAVGSDIQSITGATISSKAVTSGVNTAINYYNTNLKGAK
ncbi:MAG: RnfABCDGE type electron transport complex subunit G [Clostridium sp.]|uniref:RnfABCDGE type electron transport complex subunit G n=1 Tax=Clostridium sp. TaxID=1506 RepID=UPI0030240ED5